MKVRQSILDNLGVVSGALLGMWGIDLLMSLDLPSIGMWPILGVAVLIFCSFLGSMVCVLSLFCEKWDAKVRGADSSSQANGVVAGAGIGMKDSGL